MRLLRRLASVVGWMTHRKRAERDLDDELRSFVDMAADDRMRDGAEAAEARRAAVLHLGGVEQAKERSVRRVTAPGSMRSGATCATHSAPCGAARSSPSWRC